jgi:hypothetical protein
MFRELEPLCRTVRCLAFLCDPFIRSSRCPFDGMFRLGYKKQDAYRMRVDLGLSEEEPAL